MVSFLQLLARDIVREYGEDFSRLTVIFPNRRAGLFLAEELSRLVSRPVWMPEIFTLSEYIRKYTGLKEADPVSLVIRLYKSYRRVSGTEEKFEDFYFWGSMLLGDFDDVDKYLADARDLFSNLAALKRLEDGFSYLTEGQNAAIRQFWSSFRPERYSSEQLEFLRVWDRLYPTYTDFREHLLAEGLAYEGMNERIFCGHLEEYDHPEHILIAGFNALNACEKKIFSHYRDLGRARFYWDYDSYYTSTGLQEAGLYIRENLRLFPNALPPEAFHNFLHNGKRITCISVPSVVGQAKLLSTLLEDTDGENPRDTAVVLCDEQLLVPVLYSLPERIRKVNVTMGYPAASTAGAVLISLVCDLKKYEKKGREGSHYHYRPVTALLNHSLVKKLCPGKVDDVCRLIREKNMVYVPSSLLVFHPFLEAVFTEDKMDMPDYLMYILNALMVSGQGVMEPVEKEFVFAVYTRIQDLENTFAEEGIVPEEKLYLQLVSKIIGSISIPFSGEPLEGLQLMGLMETRLLDFSHLVLLSANEGILPKNSIPSSFIPYNLRFGFRLPTPEHQDALFAYYFYRLLQRAKRVDILYTSGLKGMKGAEMSRFIYQLKYESGLPVTERHFQNGISVQEGKGVSIPKNPEILAVLDGYTRSAEKALSPSALNTYLECPLRFYFKYVALLKEKEEVAEELDPRLLGNIFHETAHGLYASVKGGRITGEVIGRMLEDRELLERHIRRSYDRVYAGESRSLMEGGGDELVLGAVRRYIRQMLQYDRKVAPFDMLAMEERFHVPVPVGAGEGRRTVYVGGYIDRVDRTAAGIRVIDYKTGTDTTEMESLDSLFMRDRPKRNKAAFQTMLYCMMFDHVRPDAAALIPGVYSTRLLFSPGYDFRLKCGREAVADFRRYEGEFREGLVRLLEEIFSPGIPFVQCGDKDRCRNCSYAGICRR